MCPLSSYWTTTSSNIRGYSTWERRNIVSCNAEIVMVHACHLAIRALFWEGRSNTAIERSTAWMKSSFSTTTLFCLPANKAASFTRFARSALYNPQDEQSDSHRNIIDEIESLRKSERKDYPVKPVVIEAMLPRLTSCARGSSFLETCTFRIASLPALSGASTLKQKLASPFPFYRSCCMRRSWPMFQIMDKSFIINEISIPAEDRYKPSLHDQIFQVGEEQGLKHQSDLLLQGQLQQNYCQIHPSPVDYCKILISYAKLKWCST